MLSRLWSTRLRNDCSREIGRRIGRSEPSSALGGALVAARGWSSGSNYGPLEKPSGDGVAHLRNPGYRPLIETTSGRLLEEAAQRWPDRDCVISLEQAQRLSYAELLTRANSLAAGLKKIGLKQGDRLGLWGPNSVEWLVGYMAASQAGLVIAGINPFYQLSELEYCLAKIGARCVISPAAYRTQNYAEMLLQAKKTSSCLEHLIIQAEHHVSGCRRFKDVEALASKKEIEAVNAEQETISPFSGTNIQFTSGTTGNPKATLLSHHSLVNNSRQGITRLDADGRKICLNVPYFHAFGMIMGVFGPLQAGSTVVLASPTFNPAKSIDAIIGEKCSVAFGTPTMWTNMIDVQIRTGAKIDSLQTGLTGGAPASPDLYKSIRECLRMPHIKSIFGLTETTAIVNQSLRDEPPELTETSVGYMSDDIEIKVIDENGNVVPFGTAGELCVKGYSTMMGYWGDEENTKKTFLDKDWLKTGDQYVLHENGYGHIVGRLKDMLIRGGENIFPKEIEHCLETHPAILEVHAFGVYDRIYGEEICACVRLRPNEKLTAEDIRSYVKGKIAHFKIPRYIVFREEFPKTTSGKIQKFILKKELEDNSVVPKKP